MLRAVVEPLHERPRRPEEADAGREPRGKRRRGSGKLAGEAPGDDAEDRERNGDELDVDAEHLANEERRTGEVRLPFHDADEREIQDGDAELGDRRDAEAEEEE